MIEIEEIEIGEIEACMLKKLNYMKIEKMLH